MPWQFYLALLLSVATLVVAVLRVRAETAGEQEQVYLYRPLTMALISLVAMVAPQPVSIFYKGAIVLALLLAVMAEAVMMVRGTATIVAVIFVSLIAVLYLFAFTSQLRWAWPTPWALFIPLILVAVVRFLGPFLGEFWFPALAFMVILALATWMALEQFVQIGTPWSVAALFGILAVDSAATILGLREFRGGFRGDRLLMLSTYAIGQWLIAVSVWGGLRLPFVG